MAEAKTISFSKTTFSIKLLAGKNIVMVESAGYESEVFVPSIINGRIGLINILPNRRCCPLVNSTREKPKLIGPTSVGKGYDFKEVKPLRSKGGREEAKHKIVDISSSLLSHSNKTTNFNTNKCDPPKMHLHKKNCSDITENAKIAEDFMNAIATRRLAIAKALCNNKASHCPRDLRIIQTSTVTNKDKSSQSLKEEPLSLDQKAKVATSRSIYSKSSVKMLENSSQSKDTKKLRSVKKIDTRHSDLAQYKKKVSRHFLKSAIKRRAECHKQ